MFTIQSSLHAIESRFAISKCYIEMLIMQIPQDHQYDTETIRIRVSVTDKRREITRQYKRSSNLMLESNSITLLPSPGVRSRIASNELEGSAALSVSVTRQLVELWATVRKQKISSS